MRLDMLRRPLIYLLAIVFSFYVLSASGCGMAGGLVKAISPAKASPKKRVLVLPLEDKAGLDPGISEKINADFISRLRGNTQLIIHEPTTGFSLAAGGKNQTAYSPTTSLVARAGEMGMHFLVKGAVNAVESAVKKTGIWPFRRVKKEYQLSMLLDIYDTTTRTLADTKLLSGSIRLEMEEGLEHSMKEVMEELSNDVLPGLVRKHAEAASKRLSSLPWSCRVVSAKAQEIEFEAGEDLAVRVGDLFEVYAEGEEIIAGSGRPVYLIGKRIGLARVVTVMPQRSVAVGQGKDDLSSARLVYFSP
jgi:hypothetical protein